MAVRFQPIVDTAMSRVFAYQCSKDAQEAAPPSNNRRRRGFPASCGSSEFRRNGPVFVDAQETDLHSYMHQSMPRLRDIVYQFRLWSSLRALPNLHEARDAHRRVYLSLALQVEDGGSDTFAAIDSLRPDYIKLTGTLTSRVEQPACGDAVRRLIALAEKRGLILIAEDVCDLETVENLWLLGVRNMQGDYFAQKAQSKLVNPV